jgi:hypothetical protein
MTTEKSPTALQQVLGAAAFAVVGITALILFLRAFAPPRYERPAEALSDYDRAAMQAAMAPRRVAERFEEVSALGSRSVGQEGHRRCEELIRRAYRDAGLEVLEQELDTVHPLASRAELLGEDGTPTGVAVWPLYPNHVQPMVSPEDGLSGVLTPVTDELLATARDFSGMIALIDLSASEPRGIGWNAARYADLGFVALVAAHPGGLEAIERRALLGLYMTIPVNYVRVVADASVFSLSGRTVRLAVEQAFRSVANRNLIGILCAGGDAREALVVAVSYDGFSSLPDKNPCSLGALQVAIQLQLAAGMAPYRETLRRDVVFVATGSDFMAQNSQCEFLRTIGRVRQGAERRILIERKMAEHRARDAAAREILACFDDEAFCVGVPPTTERVSALPPAMQEVFDEQLRYVMRTLVFHRAEALLQARIAFEKTGDEDLGGEPYRRFRAAKRAHDQANNASSYPLAVMLQLLAETPGIIDLRAALQARWEHLLDFHSTGIRRCEEGLSLNAALSKYDNLIVVSPALSPAEGGGGREELSFTCGSDIPAGDQAQEFRRLLDQAAQELGLAKDLGIVLGGRRDHGRKIFSAVSGMPIAADAWSMLSFPAFTVVSPGNSYSKFAAPSPLPLGDRAGTLRASLAVLGETALSVAFGNGRFPTLEYRYVPSFRGSVFAAGVGTSIVPNYPVEGALMLALPAWRSPVVNGACYGHLLFYTDPYGRYEQPLCTSKYGGRYEYSPEAALFDEDGLLAYYKDRGPRAQRIYRSINVGGPKIEEPVNLVLFRATPVALLNRINPQTLKEYTGVEFLQRRSLTAPESEAQIVSGDGLLAFVPPAERFFVTLKAGSADNELVQTTRAFMLNIPSGFRGDPDREIDGPGYLAQDHPILRNVTEDIARSMAFLNERRLGLQQRYGMADEMTLEFHRKAKVFLEDAGQPGLSARERRRTAERSATYSTQNHPVVRGSIAEAIWGILWYLGLLVPFVFFAEKLVFCHTDIRRQLAAQGVIFLVVFVLLRVLHPAFQMVRSSAMILLGLVIFLVSAGVTVLLSGKFRENIEALQRSVARVKGAHASTTGIVITAFMLGLNNMHRRRVRTGLTCATLLLLTFVMICFTSVQSSVVDRTTAVTKASYSGFLVKNEMFRGISGGEVGALETRFVDRASVAPRAMYLGERDQATAQCRNPELEIVYGQGDDATSVAASSCVFLSTHEPLRDKIRMVSETAWFTEELARDKSRPAPIMISDVAARTLSIDPARVGSEEVTVEVNGKEFRVHGVFDAEVFERLQDLDGRNLLPFDIEAMIDPKISNWQVIASEEAPRIPATRVLLGLAGTFDEVTVSAGPAKVLPRTVSVAVDLGPVPYKTARREIESYLEQSGVPTYFGLEGVAFLGTRARERTVTGLIEMVIPLAIAALTVLNTMRGSVYERRYEIYVYNAVGIAPKYVFLMFMAEAMVYAVVGSLLGYILSQGTGRILTAAGLTGGLNMNFTSLSTVYASLTIAAAVFVSTIFPARSAMEIASPAEDSGWRLPQAEGDTLTFVLPFTFDHHDRIAILAFVHRYLVNHGEGGSGPFFAGTPQLGVLGRTDPLAGGAYVPGLDVMVWLKPFDLGVSQRVEIALGTDPDTGEFAPLVTLTRVTGTREAWLRLNEVFVARIRQHFLHWRAVSQDLRGELFIEARALLERQAGVSAR